MPPSYLYRWQKGRSPKGGDLACLLLHLPLLLDLLRRQVQQQVAGGVQQLLQLIRALELGLLALAVRVPEGAGAGGRRRLGGFLPAAEVKKERRNKGGRKAARIVSGLPKTGAGGFGQLACFLQKPISQPNPTPKATGFPFFFFPYFQVFLLFGTDCLPALALRIAPGTAGGTP